MPPEGLQWVTSQQMEAWAQRNERRTRQRRSPEALVPFALVESLMGTRQSMEEGGQAAFSEQVTREQRFAANENRSLSSLEEEAKGTPTQKPWGRSTRGVGGTVKRPESGTEEAGGGRS